MAKFAQFLFLASVTVQLVVALGATCGLWGFSDPMLLAATRGLTAGCTMLVTLYMTRVLWVAFVSPWLDGLENGLTTTAVSRLVYQVEKLFPKVPSLNREEVVAAGGKYIGDEDYYFPNQDHRLGTRLSAVLSLNRNKVSFWRKREELRRRPEYAYLSGYGVPMLRRSR